MVSVVGSAADEILKQKGSFIGRQRFNSSRRHGAMVDLGQSHTSIGENARLVGQRYPRDGIAGKVTAETPLRNDGRYLGRIGWDSVRTVRVAWKIAWACPGRIRGMVGPASAPGEREQGSRQTVRYSHLHIAFRGVLMGNA